MQDKRIRQRGLLKSLLTNRPDFIQPATDEWELPDTEFQPEAQGPKPLTASACFCTLFLALLGITGEIFGQEGKRNALPNLAS